MHVLKSPWTTESLIGGWAAWRKIRHDFTRTLEHYDRSIAPTNDPYKQAVISRTGKIVPQSSPSENKEGLYLTRNTP